jgi:competence protein ComFB
LSAQISRFDPDKREQKKSVVQRFITEEPSPESPQVPEPETAPEPFPQTSKYMMFNAMEEAVREEVTATIKNIDTCKCEKCYNDVCAIVLNNMPPQYVTTQQGVLIKKAVTLLSMEMLTKLSRETFDAIAKVKDAPGH